MQSRYHTAFWEFTCLTLTSMLLAASATGCGGKKNEGSGRPVTGKVTYNGQPVSGATVTFVGVANSAFGMTDAEGNFKLRSSSGEIAPLGDYQVTVTKTDAPPPAAAANPSDYRPPDPNAPPPPEPKDLLPAKYKQTTSSQLTASVMQSGQNFFEFKLTD